MQALQPVPQWQDISSDEQEKVVEAAISEKRDFICAICLEPYTNPTVLACYHIFCKSCILEAAKTSEMCPLCKHRGVATTSTKMLTDVFTSYFMRTLGLHDPRNPPTVCVMGWKVSQCCARNPFTVREYLKELLEVLTKYKALSLSDANTLLQIQEYVDDFPTAQQSTHISDELILLQKFVRKIKQWAQKLALRTADREERALCCFVCKRLYQDPTTLKCFHVFCKNCLEKRAECPQCDVPISADEARTSIFAQKTVDAFKARIFGHMKDGVPITIMQVELQQISPVQQIIEDLIDDFSHKLYITLPDDKMSRRGVFAACRLDPFMVAEYCKEVRIAGFKNRDISATDKAVFSYIKEFMARNPKIAQTTLLQQSLHVWPYKEPLFPPTNMELTSLCWNDPNQVAQNITKLFILIDNQQPIFQSDLDAIFFIKDNIDKFSRLGKQPPIKTVLERLLLHERMQNTLTLSHMVVLAKQDVESGRPLPSNARDAFAQAATLIAQNSVAIWLEDASWIISITKSVPFLKAFLAHNRISSDQEIAIITQSVVASGSNDLINELKPTLKGRLTQDMLMFAALGVGEVV